MTIAFTTSIVLAVAATVGGGPPEPQNRARPAVDPQAIAALDTMGKFLREQQSFTVRTKTEHDYVLESGQKVRVPSTGELWVRRPDHLRATTRSDRKDRQFFYDGKSFTVYGAKLGFYATVGAPPTIGELADVLEDRYQLPLPMVDLFRFGTDESPAAEITGAARLGTEKIDGVVTDHYGFRQPNLDWQIWIQRGPTPLPRKFLLTTTDDPARPEHAVELTWTLNTTHADSEFAFVPPKGSHRIAIADVSGPQGSGASGATSVSCAATPAK